MAPSTAILAAHLLSLLCLGLLSGAWASPPPPSVGNCGDGLCHCRGPNASCCGNDTATHLPNLPPQITHFQFHNFSIHNLTPETLTNVTSHNVTFLGLRYFKLRHLDPSVFLDLPNMAALDLSGNFLPETELPSILQAVTKHTKTSHLYLARMNITRVDFLDGITSEHMEYLGLQNNRITHMNFSVITGFSRLQDVSLLHNALTGVSLAKLENLQKLDLSSNSFNSIPNFCSAADAVFPKLRHLRVNKNRFNQDIDKKTFNCLTRLELIDVSHNAIHSLLPNTFGDLPRLQTLYMAQSTTAPRIDGYAFNNSNLQQIIFNNNKIYRADHIDRNAFAGCPRLSKLNFGDNELNELPPQLLDDLFAPLTSLKSLNLVQSQLRKMPPFLYHLRNLVHLYLSENLLERLNTTILAKMSNLQELDLSSNGLTLVQENAIPYSLQETLKTVALQGNPLSCTCDILWLKDWIKRNNTRFLDYPDKYLCGSPVQGQRLADVILTDQSCLLSHTTKQLVVGCSAILLLVLVVFSLVYRYRWHLQYLVFMLRYDRVRRREDGRNYRFDAFVAYSAEDHEWVVTELMAALEKQRGLKLCLHERDFVPGRRIVDNIVDNISGSRRVLVVLSEGFAQSEWCQFELSLAQRLSLERGEDLLVVVMLEKVARAHVTRVMYAVLKTTTYITWPGEERDREAFWTRLAEALR